METARIRACGHIELQPVEPALGSSVGSSVGIVVAPAGAGIAPVVEQKNLEEQQTSCCTLVGKARTGWMGLVVSEAVQTVVAFAAGTEPVGLQGMSAEVSAVVAAELLKKQAGGLRMVSLPVL